MPEARPLLAGRFVLCQQIATGGMGTVHLARLRGGAGFSRAVAIKRLHPHYANEQEFRAMFIDEARLASRIVHPNVVATLDVVDEGDELFIVMEYVHGLPLSDLLRSLNGQGLPPGIAAHLIGGALSGLHAAHEAKSASGKPLDIVHRDVSPQNILVGLDGMARLIDFGVAKAVSQIHTTRDGQTKGKLAYLSPEMILQGTVDRQSDVFSASVTLWEALTGQRLFRARSDGELIYKLLEEPIPAPSTVAPDIPPELDAVVLRGLARDKSERFVSAESMLLALEQSAPLMRQRAVAEWVRAVAGEALSERTQLLESLALDTTSLTRQARLRVNPNPEPRAEPVGAGHTAVMTSVVDARAAAPPPSPSPPSRQRAGWALGLSLLTLTAAAIAWLAAFRPAPAPTLGHALPALAHRARAAVESPPLPDARATPAAASASNPEPKPAAPRRAYRPRPAKKSAEKPPAKSTHTHLYKRE